LAAAAVPALVRSAGAQSWPNRPVRLVVGYPPGGGADATARVVASRLSEMWPQQVVIENRAGAGGNIANEVGAHAAPDGYTILFSPSPIAVSRLLFPSLTYEPMMDFAPVSLVGTYPNLLVIAKSSPVQSLQEFIANAKASPGKVTYASPGVGSIPHLTGELFKHMAKVNLTHVPYRGVAAGAMNDLLAGRIDCMFNTTASLLQFHRSGQVRGLAVTTRERFAGAPEIPTVAESGVPGFNVISWYGLFAPAKTPREIVEKIQKDTALLLREPAIQARFEPLGVEAASSTPEELAGLMQAELELWGPIIKSANIKGE